jgi:hypothetical protein
MGRPRGVERREGRDQKSERSVNNPALSTGRGLEVGGRGGRGEGREGRAGPEVDAGILDAVGGGLCHDV